MIRSRCWVVRCGSWSVRSRAVRSGPEGSGVNDRWACMDWSNYDGSYQGGVGVAMGVVTAGSVSHNDSHDAGKCNECLKLVLKNNVSLLTVRN